MEYFAAIDVSLELSSVCGGRDRKDRPRGEGGERRRSLRCLTTPASSSLGLVWKRIRCRSGYMLD